MKKILRKIKKIDHNYLIQCNYIKYYRKLTIKNNVIFVIVSSLLSWYFQVSLLNPSIPEFVLAISTLLNSLFASIIFVRKDNILYSIFPRMLYNIVICLIQFLPM